jgi:diaminopimelate epimerase
MQKIEYHKYHALGNDFIIIDRIGKKKSSLKFSRLALDICRRQAGVGADGILVLTGSQKADCRMDIYNSDGSWAEKSGNGLRITAAYFHSKYSRKKKIAIETGGEKAPAEIIKSGASGFLIRVSLGKPIFDSRKVPIRSRYRYHINRPIKIGKFSIPATAVSVGNPHTVIFVDEFSFDWKSLGSEIETSSHFPRRTNVEFVKILNRSKVILNDWERGAGATGSSGTGAAASVAAGVINGLLSRQCEVVFPTGSLFIDWDIGDDNLYLIGPVESVGHGIYFRK